MGATVLVGLGCGRFKVIAPRVERYFRVFFSLSGVDESCDICVSLVSSARIRKINQAYRGMDRYTDVLSFKTTTEEREEIQALRNEPLGDIFVAPEIIRQRSLSNGARFNRSLLRLCAHSFAHLLGYDHKTQAQYLEMQNVERSLCRGTPILFTK